MRTRILLIAVVLIALPAAALAADLEGVYGCKGTNPGGAGEYEGTVSIAKNDATYNVVWFIGSQVYLGVGIFDGESFSVAYTDAGKSFFGIVVYKVDGKKLKGVWAMQGGAKTGTETLTKR
jgi:hypothetical protein